MTLDNIPLTRNDGTADTLAAHRGKVLLVVNVASKCGLTPQYEGLEALYRKNAAQGFEVLGFPSNDFLAQEPGTDAEIAEFCRTDYDVTFPLFAKAPVSGADKQPLYAALVAAVPDAVGEGSMRKNLKGYGIEANPVPEVQWNFEKFLIGRDGRVAGRFAPDVAPDDPRLLAAVEAALAEG
ncbi:MAG: glutathione peroxidase [Paracoccaceae bacterium]